MGHRITGTNHTSFTVSSLERTLAYLTGPMGFEATSSGPREPAVIQAITGVPGARVTIAYVRGPGHSLELIEYTGPEGRGAVRPRPCDIGFAHIAYDVEGLPDLCRALEAHGVLPVAPPVTVTSGPNAGKQAVYLRDWDGLTLELIGR